MNNLLVFADNSNQIGKSKAVIDNGKWYLTVHAVMVKEGVFKGFYLPFSVLAASLNMWQGRPVIIPLHLQDTAIDTWPIELKEAHTYGFIDSPKLDHQNNAITADLFFELEKLTNSPYKSVLKNLLTGQPINNSVGMFGDTVIKEGNHKGDSYNFALEKITIADHLAVLPYNLGACSLSNGCGVGLSDTQKGGNTMPDTTKEPNGFDYEKLGAVIVEALSKADKTNQAVQLSDNERLKKMNEKIEDLNNSINKYNESLVQLSCSFEKFQTKLNSTLDDQGNKLTLALQASIQPPNTTTAVDPNEFKAVME